MRPCDCESAYGSHFAGPSSPTTPLHSPSPSSDSLTSYLSDSPSSQLSNYSYGTHENEPSSSSPSRQLVRRFWAMTLLVLFLLGASIRSSIVPESYYPEKSFVSSESEGTEHSTALPHSSELDVVDSSRSDFSLGTTHCAAHLAERDEKLENLKEELQSAKQAAEHAFWLGLGTNSWTMPMNHKRRSWGHTSFSPPSPHHSILVLSQSFFATQPAYLRAPPSSHIVGFSVQLSPDSLTCGEWKATFLRGAVPGHHARSAIKFEARTPRWLEVARWAVSWRCFGMCSDFGDSTFFVNVFVAVEREEGEEKEKG